MTILNKLGRGTPRPYTCLFYRSQGPIMVDHAIVYLSASKTPKHVIFSPESARLYGTLQSFSYHA